MDEFRLSRVPAKAGKASNKRDIDSEILLYLVENPGAQDTLEGVVEWWLVSLDNRYQRSLVQEALNRLVARRFVIELESKDRRARYRMNQSKWHEILTSLVERGR